MMKKAFPPGVIAMSLATANQLSDDQLAAQAAAGEEAAFSELYSRHSAALYDFVIRTVRDPDTAEEVVQSTFVKAWESLPALRKGAGFRSWLFTIARNRAIDECRRSRRVVPLAVEGEDEGDEFEPYAVVDPDRATDPQSVLGDSELAELVWNAASALTPKEFTLLDLHLRQGFDADELAGVLGVSKGNVYVMLTRLRHALGESVAALVLARRGSRDCASLDALLSGFENRLDRARRAAIQRHIQDCDVCRERSRRFVAPAEIFGSFAPVGFAAERFERTWARVQRNMRPRTQTGWIRGRLNGHRRVYFAVSAVIFVLIAATIAGIALTGGVPHPSDPADVRSISHRLGEPSNVLQVALEWTPPSSTRGYSFHWDASSEGLPDKIIDLPGDSAALVSPQLSPGSWYFHLRTQGKGGRWTSTVHLGPFVIVAAEVPNRLTPVAATPTPLAVSATEDPSATFTENPETQTPVEPATSQQPPPATQPVLATTLPTATASPSPSATNSPEASPTPWTPSPTALPLSPTPSPPSNTPTPTSTATQPIATPTPPPPTAQPTPPESTPTQMHNPTPTPTPPPGPTQPSN